MIPAQERLHGVEQLVDMGHILSFTQRVRVAKRPI
jgi:hypothetical protein